MAADAPDRSGPGPWYAALVDNGATYGLLRYVPGSGKVERLDRETGAWDHVEPDNLRYFAEVGGITDAIAVSAAKAEELVAALTAPPVELPPLGEDSTDG